MGPIQRRLAAMSSAVVLASALAASASAAPPPVSVTITGAHLTAKIQVTLTFDVVCQPLISAIDGSPVIAAAFGMRDHPTGCLVDRGVCPEGGQQEPDRTNLVTCDGTTVNHESVTMISSNVPFHGGTAIAGVLVNLDDPACIFCGSEQSAQVSGTVKL